MLPSSSTPRLIELTHITDARGNLTCIETGQHLPFAVQRVFYLYDVPGGSSRGGHALVRCHQLLIAMTGSFDVILKDGHSTQRITLCKPDVGLLIPPGIWREIECFSSVATCLVLASHCYAEEDYIRDYDTFLATLAGDGPPP